MKEIFNFKRFGRFLLYDLRNAKNYFWLSLLICAAMPMISFAIAQMFARLFVGTWIDEGFPIQLMSVILATIVVILTFPVKAYGSITDKRAGSNWLMIPASAEEKTLSVIVTSCVALPLAFFTLILGFDALTGLMFPDYWPAPLITRMCEFGDSLKAQTEGVVEMNIFNLVSYCWASNILTFILGSIFFKKAKIGKTFLVLFLIGQVVSMLLSMLLIGTPAFADLFQGNVESFNDPAFSLQMLKRASWLIGIYYWGYLALIIALLWARVKTMKH